VASFQPLLAIEHPRCPICQTQMTLAGTSPAPGRKETRIFYCAKCTFIETVTVPDPLTSESIQ
jgi:hypothetical protein